MLDHCQIPVGCFRGSEGAGLGSASVTGPMSRTSSSDRRHDVGIALVSLAGLLIEIAYTRVVSFKLFYYFTYLVIGLALLGLGTGGVLLAVSRRLREAPLERVLARSALAGSVATALGYVVVARMPLDTVVLWEYTSGAAVLNAGRLGLMCLAVFLPFAAIGVFVSSLLSRRREQVGRLYAADLLGAGLACALAVPLHATIGPPAAVYLAAAVLAGVACLLGDAGAALRRVAGAVGVVVLLLPILGALPSITTESSKHIGGADIEHTAWGPVFRVDVGSEVFGRHILYHDGLVGSNIIGFDGDLSALTDFAGDVRSLPFEVLGEAPERELIIGSAGGHEILASRYFGATGIDAVELNPVTTGLLEGRYREYSGNLVADPEVRLVTADGRTYLARSAGEFDLIWFVAPDSYAATNAASSGAFVLSESYLYTVEMLVESLEHLSERGVIVAQFGEFDFDAKPNRTRRYLSTARAALQEIGVQDPGFHLLVARTADAHVELATIVIKRTAFTTEEIERFSQKVLSLEGGTVEYVPGAAAGTCVAATASGSDDTRYPACSGSYMVSAIHDDSPFFWHFTPFSTVAGDVLGDVDALVDPEDAIGERLLLFLLGIALVFAAVFLLLPFVTVRRTWQALPRKLTSGVYFGSLGLGFMLFEIALIQRLTLLLGYPTYSLTVTLAALLVSTGVGASLSGRLAGRPRLRLETGAALTLLTVVYLLGVGPLTDALLPSPLVVRVMATLVLLAPLGVVLGLFMPLGLRVVALLGAEGPTYVAWAWAVNGFCSVIGSVLTTMLSMTFGFQAVLVLGLVAYVVALTALWRLSAPAAADTVVPG